MRILNDKLWNFFTNQDHELKRCYLLFIWSFLESSFWFIGSDFLLKLYGYHNHQRTFRYIYIAFFASFLGSVAYFLLLQFFFGELGSILKSTPFVTGDMFLFVTSHYDSYGPIGAMHQGFSFMSSKIWVYLAVERGYQLFPFIIYMSVFRFIRFSFSFFIGSLIGSLFGNKTKNITFQLVAVYSILFIAFLILKES